MADPTLNILVDPKIQIESEVNVIVGDLMAMNTSNQWVKADANTPSLYARYVCVSDGAMDDQIYKVWVSQRAYIADADFPYTQRTRQYLSETAGGHTETRPTTDGSVIQIVGYPISTNIVYFDLRTPRLKNDFIPVSTFDTTAEAGLGVTDAGWAGPGMDGTGATDEDVTFQVYRVPSNCVSGILKANILLNSVNASGATLGATIVGAYDGASNVQDTGTALTGADWASGDSDNRINVVDISSMLDTGMWLPGRNWQIFFEESGITNEVVVLGIWLEFEVV